MPKALIAMSGGVDSSVAAYLTLREGLTASAPCFACLTMMCFRKGPNPPAALWMTQRTPEVLPGIWGSPSMF